MYSNVQQHGVTHSLQVTVKDLSSGSQGGNPGGPAGVMVNGKLIDPPTVQGGMVKLTVISGENRFGCTGVVIEGGVKESKLPGWLKVYVIGTVQRFWILNLYVPVSPAHRGTVA